MLWKHNTGAREAGPVRWWDSSLVGIFTEYLCSVLSATQIGPEVQESGHGKREIWGMRS